MSDENTTAPTERSEFGSLRQFGKAGIWWLRYRVDGRERWESLKTSSRKQAEKKVAVIQDRIGRGEHQASDARRLGFSDLESLIRNDYKTKGRRSLPRLETALTHLRETFGSSRALGITAERIDAYEGARLEAGAARASVNYELAVLRRAFRLAVKQRRLQSLPAITISDPRNARQGFFEADDFGAVLAQLPVDLRPVMHFAYLTGWRVRSEVLSLRWDQVDFGAGIIRLEPNTTKNDEGRAFPFDVLPELSALLRAQRDATTALERSEGRIIPNVFHRAGKPIKSYKNAWEAACQRAARGGSKEQLAAIVRPKLVDRIVHDFRRTAVRNLVRAGVSEGVAMKLTGHLTRAVFERYNITNEADLRAGVAKLATHLAAPKKKAPRSTKGTSGGPLKVVSGGGGA